MEITDQLILSCLRSRWDPSALEEACEVVAHERLDWDAFLKSSRAGALEALLYAALREHDLFPAPVMETLRLAYYANARRNLILFRELAVILDRLAAEKIPAVVLKGAALAEVVYGNPAVRPMSDVDLLVREADLSGAMAALVDLGYDIIPPAAYRNEVVLQKDGATAAIELHWGLFVSPSHQHVFSMDWLWETTMPIQIDGTPTLMLGPEAQLLHLCGHLFLHHHSDEDARLLWLHDVAEVIICYQDQLDWDRLLARAQATGLVAAVQEVVNRVAADWQVPVPDDALVTLRSIHLSADEERIRAWLPDAHSSGGRRFLADLRSMPGWGARFRFLWRNLFPPVGYMRELYGVRHALLVPFLYPYRWIRGVLAVFRALGSSLQ
jgi:hypothetical protein